MFRYRNNKNNFGFSLVEVLTVITIVVIGMLGLVSLVRQNIQVQNVNKNYLIASMLSQEGLELVRNIRDENWLDNTILNWQQNKDEMVPPDNTYTIYYDEASGISINSAVNSIDQEEAKLKFTDGFYNHDASSLDDSIFSRLISAVDYGDYVAASSTVQWQDRGKTYNYVSETYFYDWR